MKKKMHFFDFESNKTQAPFTRVAGDMLKSKAWKEISLRQQGLYLYLKSKFTVYKDGTTNQNNISIPKSEAETLYGDLKTFRKDIDKLIDCGFIRQVASRV